MLTFIFYYAKLIFYVFIKHYVKGEIMNTINNGCQLNFTAKMQLAKGLGNKTFDEACKSFEILTKDSGETLHMWEDNGVYKFDLEKKTGLSSTTQYVGKDVLGYLLMETGVKDIAEFLKTTLKVVKARQKHNSGDAFMDNIRANIDATMLYIKDSVVGNKIKTTNDRSFADYDKAGACIHLDA